MRRFLYEVGVIVIILMGLAVFKWFDGGMVAAGDALKDPTVHPQAQTVKLQAQNPQPQAQNPQPQTQNLVQAPTESVIAPLNNTDTNTKAEERMGTEERMGLVNVNTANQEELMTLNGIGEVIATRIIEYRQQHGPFTCAQDLLEVKGIGEKKLEKIRKALVFP